MLEKASIRPRDVIALVMVLVVGVLVYEGQVASTAAMSLFLAVAGGYGLLRRRGKTTANTDDDGGR